MEHTEKPGAVRFYHLSWPVKTAVVVGWVSMVIYGLAFVAGFFGFVE